MNKKIKKQDQLSFTGVDEIDMNRWFTPMLKMEKKFIKMIDHVDDGGDGCGRV